MEQGADVQPHEPLDPFIGEWTMEVGFAEGLAGSLQFEWMPGERFVVQRWEVPVPEAPDGLAVIGFDEGRARYLQHYFDSRGVARVYEMSFDGRVWKLWRMTPDFSPLDFWQRYEGTFGDGDDVIGGGWEISHDEGSSWEVDFDITYRRVG
jgi:hypothetical protein